MIKPIRKKGFATVINGTRLRHSTGLFVTLLCTAGMLFACIPNKPATPSAADEVEIKTSDPLKAFEKEYEAIGKKVEEGSLSVEVMSRASEIQIRLQKYLIKTEAQLEILRLDVLHGDEIQQEKALNQMVELVAEQERTKMSYLQQLQAIKGGGNTSDDKTGKKGTAKDLDIKINIAPEDIGDGERP
jgi:hypothetical protein